MSTPLFFPATRMTVQVKFAGYSSPYVQTAFIFRYGMDGNIW